MRKKYATGTLKKERKLFIIGIIFFLFLFSAYLFQDLLFSYVPRPLRDWQIFLMYYSTNFVWILNCAVNPMILYCSFAYVFFIVKLKLI